MNEEVLKKLYDSGSKYFDLPMFEIFKSDMSDDGKLEKFRDSMSQHYSIPDFKTFKNDLSSVEKQEKTTKPKEEEVVKTEEVELVGEVVPIKEEIVETEIKEAPTLQDAEIDSIKRNFDQGEFLTDQIPAYENYKQTGELDISLLPEKKPEKIGFIQDKLVRLARGITSTGKGIAEFKNSLTLTAADVALDIFNPEATQEEKIKALRVMKGALDESTGVNQLDASVKFLGNYVREYDSESISDDILKKNYAQAADRAIGGVFESAPSLALAYTGVGGLIALGTSAAGNKFDEEFENNPEEGTKTILLNSIGTGIAEASFELVTRGILSKARLLKSSGNTKAANDLISNYSTSVIKRFATDPAAEGLSEAATEFTTDLIDIATFEKDELPDLFTEKNFKKWADAGIIGTLTGGGIVTTGALTSNEQSVRNAAEYTLTPDSDKKIINNAAFEINNLNKQIKEVDNKEDVDILEAQIANKENIIINTKKKVSEEFNMMNPDELKAYATNQDEIIKERKRAVSKSSFVKDFSAQKLANLELENQALIRESVNRRLSEVTETVDVKDIGRTVNSYNDTQSFQKAFKNTKDGKNSSMNVEGADGFIDSNGDIFINRIVAEKVKNVNVPAHELFHGIIKNNIQEPGQLNKLVDEFKSVLPKDQLEKIQKRIDDNYRYERDKEGNIIKELKKEEYNEEYFTAFADLIGNRQIKFNENIFTNIGEFLTPIFTKKGYGNIKFKTGKDVYDFIKTYQKEIGKGELSKETIEAAKKVTEEDIKTKFSKTEENKEIKEIFDEFTGPAENRKFKSKEEFKGIPKLNEKGKVVYDGKGEIVYSKKPAKEFFAALKEIEQSETLDASIRNVVGKSYLDINPGFVKEVKEKISDKFKSEYDASKNSLFGWLTGKNISGQPLINRAAGDIQIKRGKKPSTVSADQKIGGEESRVTIGETLVSDEISPEDYTDMMLAQDKLKKIKPQQSKIAKKIDLTKNELNLVKRDITNFLRKSDRPAMTDPKKFFKAFVDYTSTATGNRLYDKLSAPKDGLLSTKNRKAFIESIAEDLIALNKVDPSVMRRSNWTPFYELEIKRMNPTQTQKAIDEGRVPSTVNLKAGNDLFRTLDPSVDQVVDYLMGIRPDVLKRKMPKFLAEVIAKNEFNDIVNNPNQPVYDTKGDLTDRTIDLSENITEEEIVRGAPQVIEKIARPKGVKFSKSKDVKTKKPKGVKEKIKLIIEKAGVKPLEVKGDGRVESVEYLINDFFPTLINEFGDAARFLLKSSTISPSGNEAISKNKDGSIKKTGGAIGRDQLFITDIAKTIRSKPETQKLLDEGKLGQLKDVLNLLKADLNKNTNLENIKTATLPQKTPNIQRNLNTRKKHKEGSKGIINSLKKMYDADKKSLSGIAFLLYNANANSSFYRNLAQLISIEKGSGKNNAREEHMFQAGPWAERTLEAITKPKKIFDAYNKWQADNYYQETITKKSERLVDGKYRLNDGTFWNAKFQEHPYMKQQMDIAMKTGDFSKVPSPDIRKYNEFYGLNPNNIIREGLSDAKRYNVEVPKKLQNKNTEAFQVKLIFEQVTGKIDSKTAKKQLDQYLKIAPSQLKASKSTNTTLKNSKVLDVEGDLNIEDLLSKAAGIDEALSIARDINAPVKKIRVFDFDDTLATTKSDVLFTAPDGTEGKLNAEEFATKGKELLDEGYVFDFSEFNKVTKGKPGPLLDLAKKIQDARGTEDVFVLTARAPQAAIAIKEFLDSQGLNIPLKNITGLGKSTGEAKANWMIDKAAEGYNDFYFADDAYQNVKAVKDVMSVIDVKSKTQQAKFSLSEDLNSDFNKILENKSGIGAEKVYSDAKAKTIGASKGKFKFFIPASAEDFVGLLYPTLAKGKLGNEQMAWYKERLLNPFARAAENLSRDRVNLMSDFKALKKELEVPKDLRKEAVDGFTNEQAVRVYLWNKQGLDIPGLSKRDLKDLSEAIDKNPKLKVFADQLQAINKSDGYPAPEETWLVGTITTDLINGLNTTKRTKYLEEWQTNADIIFSKENLNKMEAIYGPKYREAMENILSRMKTGINRPFGGSRVGNQILDYLNGSVGAIMFFNTRSAVLQTISSINFINISGDNNILAAGKAFANQPQYWKDFVELINSDYLKDRRNGLKLNISESEIADAAATSKNKSKAALNYILQKGFLPTQFADSFAIASGGATFYRNKINSLLKDGLSEKEAKEQAFREFREIAEESQQSSRPDKISQQQASSVGRVILAFANTPSQYARIIKKAASDLKNKRGDWKNNISKIIYYGAMQNLIFNALQQALFAVGFGDEEEDDEKMNKRYTKIGNGMVDSLLRGLGYGGAAISVAKNLLLDVYERSNRKRPEYVDAAWKLLQFSPPISSKISKLKQAGYMVDKYGDEMIDKGFAIDNPAYEAASKVVTATTNVPLDRLFNKANNISAAMDEDSETWQSVAMLLGWSEWQIKPKVKKKKKKKKSIKKEYKKEGLIILD